mgnify:CR=1 FL=1
MRYSSSCSASEAVLWACEQGDSFTKLDETAWDLKRPLVGDSRNELQLKKQRSRAIELHHDASHACVKPSVYLRASKKHSLPWPCRFERVELALGAEACQRLQHNDGSVRIRATDSMEQCWAVQEYLRSPETTRLSARARAAGVAGLSLHSGGRSLSSRDHDMSSQRRRCLSRAEQIQCAIRLRPTAHASATKWPSRSGHTPGTAVPA